LLIQTSPRPRQSREEPLGNAHFIEVLERIPKLRIARRAPGRKPVPKAEDQDRLV
jgi:hypothetical protein